MELADLVFEELVEEVVNEMPHTIKSVFQWDTEHLPPEPQFFNIY